MLVAARVTAAGERDAATAFTTPLLLKMRSWGLSISLPWELARNAEL